ncbi:MAG: hypothetical protein M0038_05635 [Pseudomonadota bacterium]|jgi:hypothetical protein|nr:hypothetical protein [Pseudomonadota bacterium]
MAEANQATRANSTKLVWIGCKLPQGATLELFEEPSPDVRKAMELGLSNPRVFMPPVVKARFTLKGANSVVNDFSVRGLAQPSFGYGITPIPEDFWNEWLAQHKGKAAVMRGFIFAMPNERAAMSESKDRAAEATGLEPLRPDVQNDRRVNTGSRPEERVEADATHLARLNKANGG